MQSFSIRATQSRKALRKCILLLLFFATVLLLFFLYVGSNLIREMEEMHVICEMRPETFWRLVFSPLSLSLTLLRQR